MASMLIRWLGGAAVILAALLAHGCGAETRYQVLSTIFDGVPPPPGAVAETADTGALDAPSPPAPPRAKFRQHSPFAKHNCDACHEPGTNIIRANLHELCQPCHAMVLEKKNYVHGPVVTGSCLYCHSAHGSRYPWLLNTEPRELCLSCHDPENVFQNEAHKDRELTCTECHNPHADNRYFLKSGLQPLAPP